MFDENITPSSTTDEILTPKISYFGAKTRKEFSGSCLKQDKITYIHGKIVNIYIVYEINNILILAVIQHWKIVYLEELVWLKILILISINSLGTAFDTKECFHLVMELVKM